jgi:dihydroflavonol-4-reductase
MKVLVTGGTGFAGRRRRIVAAPDGLTLALGRVADLMQRLTPARLPLNYEGPWIFSLQPHCDDSKTISELGVTPRDLKVTLTDTVRWLADQGHLPAAWAANTRSGDGPRSEPSAGT